MYRVFNGEVLHFTILIFHLISYQFMLKEGHKWVLDKRLFTAFGAIKNNPGFEIMAKVDKAMFLSSRYK